MPRKSGDLTPREARFIELYAETQDRAYAEKEAGYRRNGGYEVLARPDIQREIDRRQEADLREMVAICTRWARNAMLDAQKPDTLKEKITNTVYRHYYAQKAPGEDGKREPWEMTADELAAQIRELEGAAAAKAKPIEDAETVDEAESGVFD